MIVNQQSNIIVNQQGTSSQDDSDAKGVRQEQCQMVTDASEAMMGVPVKWQMGMIMMMKAMMVMVAVN